MILILILFENAVLTIICRKRALLAKMQEIDLCKGHSLFLFVATLLMTYKEQYVSTLEFRTFDENLRCLYSPSVLPCEENETQEDMASKINAMEVHIRTLEQCHSLLQKLQMSKQLEYRVPERCQR